MITKTTSLKFAEQDDSFKLEDKSHETFGLLVRHRKKSTSTKLKKKTIRHWKTLKPIHFSPYCRIYAQ